MLKKISFFLKNRSENPLFYAFYTDKLKERRWIDPKKGISTAFFAANSANHYLNGYSLNSFTPNS